MAERTTPPPTLSCLQECAPLAFRTESFIPYLTAIERGEVLDENGLPLSLGRVAVVNIDTGEHLGEAIRNPEGSHFVLGVSKDKIGSPVTSGGVTYTHQTLHRLCD